VIQQPMLLACGGRASHWALQVLIVLVGSLDLADME